MTDFSTKDWLDYLNLIAKVYTIDREAALYLLQEALEDFSYGATLPACFPWVDTPQGHDYWHAIYSKLQENNMGMYTEILVKAQIKPDTSEEDRAVLLYLFNKGALPEKIPNHRFFTKPRWDLIGTTYGFYHHPVSCNSVVGIGRFPSWYIFSRSDLKNYDGEVDAFFDWFRTICDEQEGKCIGYTWYAEEDVPTLVLM